MATITKPGYNPNAIGKAVTVGSIIGGVAGAPNAQEFAAMNTAQKLSSGASMAGTIRNVGGLRNETSIVPVEKPSAMSRRLEPQKIDPQETLNILKRGEIAINELGRQDPSVFEQYYKPLADTMFAVYNDPRFAQFKNPNYGQDQGRG